MNRKQKDIVFIIGQTFFIFLVMWLIVQLVVAMVMFYREVYKEIPVRTISYERLFLKDKGKVYDPPNNILISDNFLLPISSVIYAKQEVNAIITGYSSTVEQCDDTPFITASGDRVRDGIVANNCLPFGTMVETEEGEMLEVKDRMNRRYGCEYFDKWFSTTEEAKEHGVKEKKLTVY